MNGNRKSGCAWRRCTGPAIGLVLVCACAVSVGQTTLPVQRDAIEQQPVRQRATTQPGIAAQSPSSRSQGWMDFPRVVAALGIVLGLIFALRWAGRRYFPGLSAGRAASVVRVLSRSPVAPRQHVLLVQVGRRVLVVADNGTQLSPLADITDPDEVASLLGQLTAKPEAPAEPFDGKLDEARESFEPHSGRFDEAIDPEPQPEAATAEIEGLMQKVRTLARQLGRS